jgi:thioredoxin 1
MDRASKDQPRDAESPGCSNAIGAASGLNVAAPGWVWQSPGGSWMLTVERPGPHTMTNGYSDNPLTRAETDAAPGAVVLDFGTNWCSHCRAVEPLVTRVLALRPDVRHIKIEDGSGRRLGRSYGVKLWPTLIFLQDGKEVARFVRPRSETAIATALAELAG